MSLYNVLRRPIITEKVTRQGGLAKYAFEVDTRATKIDIKRAVELAFQVVKVNTMIVPGKMRRLGRHTGMTPSWKKAVVTLEKGQKIDLFEGV